MISGVQSLVTKPMPGARLNPAHPLSRGLVGYWLFNEGAGSRANDISGNGNHGTLTNMAPNTQGSGWGGSKFGGGLQFDGSSDYVNCGNDSSINFGTGDFSISCMINTVTTGSYQLLVGKHHSPGYELYVSSGDKAYFQIGDSSGWVSKEGNAIIADGEYHVITVVFDRDLNGTIYVDGVFDAYQNISTRPGSVDSANVLRFGRTTTSSYPYTGEICFVRFHNHVLSAVEIKQLYEYPFCNILTPRRWYVPAAGPSGVIMNQFQKSNIGADLYNGVLQ